MDARQPLRLVTPLALWLSLVCLSTAALAATPPRVDLRVLIDVSGSMKKNDPRNLRVPALRLLVGLLPDGSRAGVWTFGHRVRTLAPIGEVGKAWRRRALAAAEGIRSREQLTDIEQGLRKATAGWEGRPPPGTLRNVILLTDGLVDVGKDPARNRASRQRVLDEVLPRLEEAGVKIHTVALSEHADHALLRRLALMTDGWYETVEDAERLSRVFLHIFESMGPANGLAIADGGFGVDSSIERLRVLLFHGAPGPAPVLTGPDERVYRAGQHPPGVEWRQEAGYDLVSVPRPAPGQWRVDASADPENRVLVKSDLRLELGELPAHLLVGDRVKLGARLAQEGKGALDPSLAAGLAINARLTGADGADQELVLRDDGQGADDRAGDGTYSTYLDAPRQAGDYALTVRAQAGDLLRAERRRITVHRSPVAIEIGQLPAAGYRVRVRLRPELLAMASVSVRAEVPGAGPAAPALQRAAEAEWRLDLPARYAGQGVRVRVDGRLRNGRIFSLDTERLLPGTAPASAEGEAAGATVPESQGDESEAAGRDEAARPAPVHWLRTGMIVALANLLVVPLVIAGVVYWRRRRARAVAMEQEALGE